MTSEPRMESLLASIRRAIDEDLGTTRRDSAPPQRPRPIEMQRRPAPPVRAPQNSASEEIRELRDKIRQAREREASLRASPAMARSSVFAETLGGDAARAKTRRQPSARPPQEPVFEQIEPEPHYAPEPRDVYDAPESAEIAVVDAWNESLAKRTAPSDSRSLDAMLSSEATAAASTAFNRLADTILSRAVGDRSVEDITRELLRNMLKQWLDTNLPELVERLVREEIERVARRGR